jgi:hypothetical protein
MIEIPVYRDRKLVWAFIKMSAAVLLVFTGVVMLLV